jgi:hypothetical protein
MAKYWPLNFIADFMVRYNAPTPWRAEPAQNINSDKYECRIADAAGIQFARVYGAGSPQTEAMARVMALAPELAATLRWIAEHGDTGANRRPAYHDMRTAARNVLAKLELPIERKIVTSRCDPPLHMRRCDWCAWYEDEGEEALRYGYGCTREEAIADLKENYT